MQNILITSFQNKQFKELSSLRFKKSRESSGKFLIEGLKEIKFALKNFFDIKSIWIVKSKIPDFQDWLIALPEKILIYEISTEMFEKIGYREKTEGIAAVASKNICSLETFKLDNNKGNLIMLADNIEKPGNLGTLFRVADAVGAKAIFLTEDCSDIYNPNTIRNSVGTFFSIPFFISSSKTFNRWIKDMGFYTVAANPESPNSFWDEDYKSNTCLIFGNEHSGLSKFWKENCDIGVSIPMLGQNDSLNISVSAAVLGYEWKRKYQQGFVSVVALVFIFVLTNLVLYQIHSLNIRKEHNQLAKKQVIDRIDRFNQGSK